MMNTFIKHRILTIKTSGPVFVGDGQSISKKEFILDRPTGTVHILDLQKMFRGLQKRHMEAAYEQYLMDPNTDLFRFFKEKQIGKAIYNDWILRSMPLGDRDLDTKTTKQISTFSRDGAGNAYIPGSSMKGALRTILENYVLLTDSQKKNAVADRVKNGDMSNERRKLLLREDEEASIEVFHRDIFKEDVDRRNIVNDVMRALHIGDSNIIANKDFCLCQKIDMTSDGKVKPLPILRECLKPRIEVQFPLEIDEMMFPADWDILKAIEAVYTNYKIEFMCKYPRAPKVYGNKTTFFLGGGAGYPSKSILYSSLSGKEAVDKVSRIMDATVSPKDKARHSHAKDPSRGVSPHTIKLTKFGNDLYQMGACYVTAIKKEQGESS